MWLLKTFLLFCCILKMTSRADFSFSICILWHDRGVSFMRMWYFLPCQTHQHNSFLSFRSQCSGTQYVRCTDFRPWTANGCLCGNKWKSALCHSASPNSCSLSTFRRTWAGELPWNHFVNLLDLTAKVCAELISLFLVRSVTDKPLKFIFCARGPFCC